MKLVQIIRLSIMEQSAHWKFDKAFVVQYPSSKVGHAFSQFALTKWTSLWIWIHQQLMSPFTHLTPLDIMDLQSPITGHDCKFYIRYTFHLSLLNIMYFFDETTDRLDLPAYEQSDQ